MKHFKFFLVSLMAGVSVSTAPAVAASSVSVNIDGKTYACSENGTNNGECTIVQSWGKDKYGTECKPLSNYDKYCTFFYQFGLLISSGSFSAAHKAADWCKEQLAGS